MAGKPSFWTDTTIDRAIVLARELGRDRRKVADALGVSYASLGGALQSVEPLREAWQALGPTIATPRFAASLDPLEMAAKVREAYQWLAVVDVPPLPRVPVTTTGASVEIVVSDLHFPREDPAFLSIVFQVLQETKASGLTLNGDGPDMLALSRFPKDARLGKSWGLGEEQRASKSFWRTAAEIGQSWDVRLTETEANHSGNDLASRWRRYLNERVPELFDLDGFEELASYARFFHPLDLDIQLVNEVVISPDNPSPLRILHGWKANQKGGYTAANSGDAIQGSVLVGHTHRVGSSNRRVPAITDGNGNVIRAEHQHRRYETGCGCLLGADYAPHADWGQAFALVNHTPDDFSVELVTVSNGRAVVGMLGREVRAG